MKMLSYNLAVEWRYYLTKEFYIVVLKILHPTLNIYSELILYLMGLFLIQHPQQIPNYIPKYIIYLNHYLDRRNLANYIVMLIVLIYMKYVLGSDNIHI